MDLKDLLKDKANLIQQIQQISGALIYIDQKIKQLEGEKNGEKMAEDSGQENIHK